MEDVLTVAELTGNIAELIGEAFPDVAVRGQISNLRRPGSGHAYFSLKDEGAQLPCAMWRSSVGRLRFRPEDGQDVVAVGRVEVYPPHGKYQLIVRSLSPMGVGELHLRFEQLKKQLAAEGLFDADRKQVLPMVPQRVAVVTSNTSAALRDFLRIAHRRMPSAWITVFPVRVQGDGSAEEIAEALGLIPHVGDFDAVVVTRGGGSIEDLWAFNEEVVARAIDACEIPVVSAVGHEIDTTIADLVADVRAATPSEAAEILFPETAELAAQVADGRARLERAVRARLDRERDRLTAYARSHALARPLDRLRRVGQDLDEWEARAQGALERRVRTAHERIARVASHLHAVSPLGVLGRGYSITTRDGDRVPLTTSADAATGDRLRTRLASGFLISEVLSTEEAHTAQENDDGN